MSDGPLQRFRGGKLLIGGLLLALVLLLLVRWAVTLYVEHLWYAAEGRTGVFWARTFWEWGARAAVGIVTGVLVWINLRLVARTFTGIQIRRKVGDLVIQEQLPRAYIRWGIVGTAAVIGLWFSAAVPPGTGLQALLLVHGPAVGEVDPILGRDLGFYLFRYPVLSGLVTYGLVAAVFLVAVSAAGYTATGAIRWGGGRVHADFLPRRHLGILAAAFLALVGLRFVLAPYGLLMDGNSAVEGIFGYTDHHARIPGQRMAAFLAFATAGVAAWGARQGRMLPAIAGGGALAIVVLAVVEIYPAVIQRFQVEPNQLARERPYIEHAIDFTTRGFDLEHLERGFLDYRPPSGEDWDLAAERLARLPVWTEPTLLSTFRQVDARFRYYDFSQVAFDRYPAGEGVEPVAVSVREVDPQAIPDRSWENLHLREHYITGEGAVAGQLTRQTVQGRVPMLLTGLPPEFRALPGAPDEIRMERPLIYVGSRPQYHAVITPTTASFLAPDGGPGVPGEDFPAGIPVTSALRTLALAWHLQDINLLLSSEVTRQSRLVFRRDVASRVQALAPFLRFPEAPYPVVAGGRVVWIVEGFTMSRSYPLSAPHTVADRLRPNYVRNAVKATVDAVTGETRFYAATPEDPLVQAWSRAFPGLIEDLDRMPPEHRRHVRYSRWLLEAQAQVLVRYHQTDPAVFHAQRDRWELAQELTIGGTLGRYRPEYAPLTLPGEEAERFTLSTTFVPLGRQTLASAFLAAGWNEDGGRELRMWDLPIDAQLPGPRQVQTLVEQDPDISQLFSLWRQSGSQVWSGHLHVVPVNHTLLYMQPIFLAADLDAIPEIRRYVVSDGRRVVMERSLGESLAALRAGEGVVVELNDLPAPADPEVVRPPAAPVAPEAPLSREALQLLDEAEGRLRAGDWEGFGRKLEELRELLRRQVGPG